VNVIIFHLFLPLVLSAGPSHLETYGIHQELPMVLAPYLSPAEQLALITGTGATSIRQRMRWDRIEGVAGQYDWTVMDQVVDELVNAGIDPLIILQDTPDWAADPACPATEASICPPDLEAWGSFVSAAVGRYQGKVTYWEIWNEPNSLYRWAGTSQDYYLLLQRAATDIRATDPEARILIGGMTHESVLEQGDWLRALLGAPDLGELFDVFSFHLYGSVGQPEETFASLYDLLGEFGLSGKEVWVTETNPHQQSEAEQAAALEDWHDRIFLLGAKRVYYFTMPNWCGDDLTWGMEWCDANVYGLDKPTGGLVHDVDFTPTLVYQAYQEMTAKAIFVARLVGDEQVPLVVSDATAVDLFHLNAEGTLLRHVLFVARLRNATQAHIHCAVEGEVGPSGVTLYAGRPKRIKAGILASGLISMPDPGNKCGWVDLNDVVNAMRSGAAYVDIHTLAHLGGEIRGQIR
jgi:hypothetical protein